MQLSSAGLVADILAPLNANQQPWQQVDVNSSSSEDEFEDELNITPTSTIVPTPCQLPPLPRPQVGNKTPKSSFPPKKCLNVHCKEEKAKLMEEIASLKEEIENCKYS